MSDQFADIIRQRLHDLEEYIELGEALKDSKSWPEIKTKIITEASELTKEWSEDKKKAYSEIYLSNAEGPLSFEVGVLNWWFESGTPIPIPGNIYTCVISNLECFNGEYDQ